MARLQSTSGGSSETEAKLLIVIPTGPRAPRAVTTATPVLAEPLGNAATPMQLAPSMVAVAALAGLALFAGPVFGYMEHTAEQLFDRAGYIEAVLGQGKEG